MSSYTLFPAVDENFDFPEAVRLQLANSPEFRNMIIPMSESTRDSLTVDELWIGRTIYNTTKESLESFKESNTWITYLDSAAYVPEPPLPWDENYIVPEEVRIELSKSEQLRNMVTPMTESVRDALTGIELWSGRTIYNLTIKAIETWNSSVGSWIRNLDETYVPPVNEWESWTPVLEYYADNTNLSSYYTAVGRSIIEGGLVTAKFKISFTGTLPATTEPRILTLSLPAPVNEIYNIYQIGSAIFDLTASGGGRMQGCIDVLDEFRFHYTQANGYSAQVTNEAPLTWISGCNIQGDITYELGV